MDIFSLHTNQPFVKVHCQPTSGILFGADCTGRKSGSALAQGSPDSGQQFRRAKRLGDVIVGAQIQRLYFLFLLVPGGNDQNRDLIPLTQPAQHFYTVHVRQPQIQQNQIRALRAGQRQRLPAVFDGKRYIMIGRKNGFHHMGNGFFILYNQNFMLGHRFHPPLKAK